MLSWAEGGQDCLLSDLHIKNFSIALSSTEKCNMNKSHQIVDIQVVRGKVAEVKDNREEIF
jgi:hypothetical protein